MTFNCIRGGLISDPALVQDEPIEWISASQFSDRTGTFTLWKGFVDGTLKYSILVWDPDGPDAPPSGGSSLPLDLAA